MTSLILEDYTEHFQFEFDVEYDVENDRYQIVQGEQPLINACIHNFLKKRPTLKPSFQQIFGKNLVQIILYLYNDEEGFPVTGFALDVKQDCFLEKSALILKYSSNKKFQDDLRLAVAAKDETAFVFEQKMQQINMEFRNLVSKLLQDFPEEFKGEFLKNKTIYGLMREYFAYKKEIFSKEFLMKDVQDLTLDIYDDEMFENVNGEYIYREDLE